MCVVLPPDNICDKSHRPSSRPSSRIISVNIPQIQTVVADAQRLRHPPLSTFRRPSCSPLHQDANTVFGPSRI
ncbi:hypothetical protein BDZ89DRAFT_1068560, partial [Hymenopellis radicata]